MTRAQARAAGVKRFTGGPVCYQGHKGERYTGNGDCCQCTLERNRHNRGSRARSDRYVTHLRRSPEQHHGLMSAATGRGEESRVPALVDFTGKR